MARRLPKHWWECKNEAEEARWWDANLNRILEEAIAKRYTLEELLAQCDPKARLSKEDREWLGSGSMTSEDVKRRALDRLQARGWQLPPGWKWNRQDLYDDTNQAGVNMTATEPTTRPANDYVPDFRDEGDVKIVAAGGIIGIVEPVPACLEDNSLPGLVAAMNDLGYSPATFYYWPFYGGVAWFSDMVPWLSMTDSYLHTFYVNAGIFANYWAHGVNPFVGSSYEQSLRADINYRFQAAAAGYPTI